MPTNKEIIAAAYASFAKGDVPSVLAVMDPKIEWTEAEGWPLYSGTLVGPQAVVDGVFMRLGEIGENFSVNVTQLVAEGDTVVGLGTSSWNRNGSGEPAEVKIAHVWTLATGRSLGSNSMSTPPRSAISSPESSVGSGLRTEAPPRSQEPPS